MTKNEAMNEHIALREEFYLVKFNARQRVWAKFCMFFYRQALIESANRGLRHNISIIGNINNVSKYL
jgi:hypothetical protein